MSTTETQSEALRLAGELDKRAALAIHPVVDTLSTASADALRRLDAENKALRAKADASDTERLDWVFRQADEFSCYVLCNQPGDGLYRVVGMGAKGEAETPREALDKARAAQAVTFPAFERKKADDTEGGAE